MADDRIDIEEHDILDNPVVRRMFPDISVLKKEVLDFDEVLIKEFPAKYPASIKDDYNGHLPFFLNRPAELVRNTKFTKNIFTQIDEAKKYSTIVIDETNVASSFHSSKPGDQVIDKTFARNNNSTQIYYVTDEYPTIVIEDTNDTLFLHSSKQEEIIDATFAENNSKQINETEKCPVIEIDEANITVSHYSSKSPDQDSKFTEVIHKQKNETEKYPTIVIDEFNKTLIPHLNKIVDEVIDANDLNESEKGLAVVIKENYKAVQYFSSSNQVLDPNNTESNCTQNKETEKYSMIENEANKVIVHCDSSNHDYNNFIHKKSTKSNFTQINDGNTYSTKLSNAISTNLPFLLKPAEQGYNEQFSQTYVRGQNYESRFSKRMKIEIDTKKKFTNDLKMKPIEQNELDASFLLKSKNITCNINEEKCNKVNFKLDLLKLSKSVQKKNTLPTQKNKQSVNLDRKSTQCLKQHGYKIPLPVSSSAKPNSHCAKNCQFDQYKWIGNKIILGSKSSALKSQNNVSANQNISSNVRVLVENLETFLSKSTRYCKKCFILFPSNKTLADHRDRIHSQLHNNQSSKCRDNIRKVVKPSNLNQKYKCNVCGRVFISLSNLLKHKMCVHSDHIKKWKDMENLNQSIQPENRINVVTNFTCTHCNERFPSRQILIDHMYNVLQNKSNRDDIKSSLGAQKVHTKSRVFYRCPFCSYYFVQKHNCVKHLRNKHNTDNINLKKVEFDSICNYCYGKYSEFKSYNVHVWQRHLKKLYYVPKNIVEKGSRRSQYKEQAQSMVNNNKDFTSEEEVAVVRANINEKVHEKYLLKSVVFKCVKCKICFLSGEKAANHIGHEFIQTNWKCSKCSQIFHKEDQNRHAYQHFFCDSFEVVEISKYTYVHLLFKCPNCASYFREIDFFYHFSICEMQSPNSAYCKTCHILIDNNIKEMHEIHHNTEDSKKLNNILIETDVITYEVMDNRVKESFDLPMTELVVKRSYYISHEKNDDEIQNALKITNNGSNENNVTNSVMSSDFHKDYTEVAKRIIETKDFSRKRMTTTIVDKPLRFMYCGTCKAFIFVSTVRKLYNHIKGRCLNLTKYVCKYCGLVLSNKTIDSHRKLHQDLPNLTLNDFSFFDLQNGKEISPPVPKYPNCHLCEKHFITKTAIISHVCNEDYLKCSVCHIKLSKNAFSLHMSFHKYYSKTKSKLLDLSIRSKESHLSSETMLPHLLEARNTNLEDKYLLVYICKICKVAVDSYDTVIEHCHYHICNQEKEILTKLCDLCNFIFTDTCFINHKMLHSCNQNKKFSSLTYDAFYVTAVDKVWLNHLFGSLSKNVISDILKNSIYNFERKVKMQILQDGSPDLTFYKCAKCGSVVDPSCLYDHCRMDILCYKSKIVPCPDCGILMSDEFLIKHKKIHGTQNVTSVLYRFVLFNCDDDKTINQRLSLPQHYILYECRNCNGVVDRKQFQKHKCNFEDLSKCSHCGLLLYHNDYMPHVVKHKEFCSFQESNMIVILIGSSNEEEKLTCSYKSSFRGIKLDYLIYKCNSCQVCHKDKQSSLTHNCAKNLAKTKCIPCDLYFEDSSFKKHRKLHECDPYFSKENVTILELDLRYSTVSRPSNIDVIVIEDEEDLNEVNHNTVGDNQLHSNNLIDYSDVVEKYDEIFRCECGLHFMTESSALSHITQCNNARSSKQTCPKCGLLFKPNILYSHILKHHNKKGVSYKFNITPISKKK